MELQDDDDEGQDLDEFDDESIADDKHLDEQHGGDEVEKKKEKKESLSKIYKMFENINIGNKVDTDEFKLLDKKYVYDQEEIDAKLEFFRLLTGNCIENVQNLLDTCTYQFLVQIRDARFK